ncbi:MAG: hypothetical protein M1819_001030 [Sarea resinae]|nr:MAG: hypothetical protein M1819_001030 [Sarea resinae]
MSLCVVCQQPLVVSIQPDEEEEDFNIGGSSASTAALTTVPDDVELTCGCHSHWQCLLDGWSSAECPNCSTPLISISPLGEQQVLCTLTNEGGVQESLDILPLLREEVYINAHPQERRSRAFLEFCREGDIEAIVDLLTDNEEEEEESQKIDPLRYQDPIGNMSSALHVAILNKKVEVIWLLLLIASHLPMDRFPPEVFQAAEQYGITREDQSGKEDIRLLKDAEGRTAEMVAANIGWYEWVGTGILAI